jgi:hypothetical protein
MELFDPEDGGDVLFRNVGWLSPGYTVSCPRNHLYENFLKCNEHDYKFVFDKKEPG